MKKLVILTGAGISAESGINTFRDVAEGYWKKYKVKDVCTHTAYEQNPQAVLDFCNYFYDDVKDKRPNIAHLTLKDLEAKFDVTIITQNIDDLHEKAGSTKIIHIHGDITQVRSTKNPNLVISRNDLESPYITVDSVAPDGGGLRPNIVLFEEAVPLFEDACRVAAQADIFVVIGTSFVVYPAASLIEYIPASTHTYFIDPYPHESVYKKSNMTIIAKTAGEGVPELAKLLESEV